MASFNDSVINAAEESHNGLLDGDTVDYGTASSSPGLVRGDEELVEVSTERLYKDERPRSRSVSNRFISSIHSFTVHSIREVHCNDRNNTAFSAGFNVTNLIQGIGIMGVPYAVSRGSWASVPVICILAGVCCFTGCLLVDCLYTVCPRTKNRVRYLHSYPDIGAKVWPRFGRQVVTAVSVIEMFGGMCLYIILLASTSSSLFRDLVPQLNIYHWSVITTYATMPLSFITRMSIISWFSMFAVVCLMTSITVVLVYCGVSYDRMALTNMPVFDMKTFPVAFGVIVFSYCAHAVFPSIESSMTRPASFSSMMRIAFAVAAVVKSAMGVMAALIFGMSTAQEFGQNMADSDVFSTLINSFIFVNVFFSMPLVMFVVVERFDSAFQQSFHPAFHTGGSCNWLWIFLTRCLIVTAGLFISMLIPHFALLMGLVGSFTGSLLSFIFPTWFHLALKKDSLSKFGVGIRVLILALGVISGATGVFFSAIELWDVAGK